MLVALTFILIWLWLCYEDGRSTGGPAIAAPLAGYEAVLDEPDAGEHPLIVLLHANGSEALEALSLLAGVTRARVVAPLGRYVHDGQRSFLEPSTPCPVALRRAVSAEVAALRAFIDAALLRWPTRGPVVVVGLGPGGGMLALTLGLTSPMVMTALAYGGQTLLTLIPPINEFPGHRLRSAAWGESLHGECFAEALAQQRGFDFKVEAIDRASEPAEDATTWLLPHLTLALEEKTR